MLQGRKQTLIVPLVQSDTGFIQNIQNTGQFGADLGGQANSLAFTPGKGIGSPIQGQIGQPYVFQKAEAFGDLF